MDLQSMMVQALKNTPENIGDPNLQWRDPVPATSAMVKALYGGVENTAKGAIDSANTYSQTGEYNPKPVMDAALMAAGGASPFAEAGAAGVFGGRMAKTSDLRSLGIAKQLQADLIDKGTIHRMTNWYQGPDGQWRFEIPDNNAALKPGAFEAAISGKVSGRLPDYLDHPELFHNYPYLKSIVMHSDVPPGSVGVSEGGAIGLGRDVTNHTDLRNTILHEAQHEIQKPEGFMTGSGPIGQIRAMALPPRYRGQLDFYSEGSPYWNQYSEIEARNAERRADLPPEIRRAYPPWITEDVAPSAIELTSPAEKYQALVRALRAKGEM